MPKKKTSSGVLRENHSKRLKKIRILVIHESQDATELFKNMLEVLGFGSVLIARCARDGMQLMRDMHIDIVLTDSKLILQPMETEGEVYTPYVSGADFIRRLRHSHGSPNRFMPMMILVGGDDGKEMIEARDAGVNEMVLKPLTGENFCKRMVNLFDRPRHFITADSYKGPCRRLKKGKPKHITQERRVREIRVIRYQDVAV